MPYRSSTSPAVPLLYLPRLGRLLPLPGGHHIEGGPGRDYLDFTAANAKDAAVRRKLTHIPVNRFHPVPLLRFCFWVLYHTFRLYGTTQGTKKKGAANGVFSSPLLFCFSPNGTFILISVLTADRRKSQPEPVPSRRLSSQEQPGHPPASLLRRPRTPGKRPSVPPPGQCGREIL